MSKESGKQERRKKRPVIVDDCIKLDGSISAFYALGAVGKRYTIGVVKTPFGIVSTYSQADIARARGTYTRLDFVHGGRLHMRTIYKALTQRGMVSVARRFAAQFSTDPAELAAKIARALFSNGQCELAERLVMAVRGGDIGGYSERGAARTIEDALKKHARNL